MRIRVSLLIAGVAVLGLVIASPSFGSNMGFKLERNLPANIDHPTFGTQTIQHIMSFPFFRSYADVSTAPNGEDKDGNTLSGINDMVGVVDAQDVLLDLWNADQGTAGTDKNISLLRFNTATNQFENVSFTGFGTTVLITGQPNQNFSLEGDDTEGYLVQVTGGSAAATDIRSIIVGSHNPSTTVKPLVSNVTFNMYGLPYHTTHTHSDCAGQGPTCDGLLESFLQGNSDGFDCPTGMDDGDSIAILDFDGEAGGANPGTDGSFFNRAATCFGGTLIFSGDVTSPFALTPGNGYLLNYLDGNDSYTPDLAIPHY